MSGYILNLRKTVGHRPLLQVGASVIVTDPAGCILLQLRRDCRCWGYAGGSVELDEAAQDAARRELKEETDSGDPDPVRRFFREGQPLCIPQRGRSIQRGRGLPVRPVYRRAALPAGGGGSAALFCPGRGA